MAKINDSTTITIPLRNLLALVAGTAIAVTGYFSVVERITMLEQSYIMVQKDVDGNSKWIVEWEKEGLLPADIIQNNKLEFLESRVLKMENVLEK